MTNWDLRDEIADIIDDALHPKPWTWADPAKVTDLIMALLERSTAEEPANGSL